MQKALSLFEKGPLALVAGEGFEPSTSGLWTIRRTSRASHMVSIRRADLGLQRICAEPWRLACRAPSRSVSCTNPCTNLVAARGHHRSGDRFRVRDYRLGPLSARSQVRPRSMYPSLVMRLREGLLHRAGGGHDHLTSTTLPAGCTIKPPDAGSRQCLWVTALLREQLASSTPSGSWPKLTPPGQHAWRDTNRSSGACSNACGRTGSNRSATRSPSLLIRRSMESVRSVLRNPESQVSVLLGVQNGRHSPVPSGQFVRKLCEIPTPGLICPELSGQRICG
jgi:hypothetical protein